jgi:hypothetical protein
MNEFEWEKQFKKSDALTDKFQKVFEKYFDHPDRDHLIAEEMGWNSEKDLSHDNNENVEAFHEFESAVDTNDVEPNLLTEGVDWVRDESGNIHHPLTLRIIKDSMSMWHVCEKEGIFEDQDICEMISQFQIAGAKVAGALDSDSFDEDREGGFIVACLKRSLFYLHQSIAAAEKVKIKNLISLDKMKEYQSNLFEIREQILALMNRFRDTNNNK